LFKSSIFILKFRYHNLTYSQSPIALETGMQVGSSCITYNTISAT
jgi:hypothetical protein